MKDLFSKNFALRLVSGLILGSITGFCLWKGNFYFSALILTIAIISYLEWFTIVSNSLEKKHPNDCKSHIFFWGVIGLFAILPSAISMIYLRHALGLEKVLYLILVIISTDIGAFIFGKIIGGPKLAPTISPGKTLSGAVSGICVAIAVVFTLRSIEYIIKYHDIKYITLIMITVILSIASQVGDLIESGFKRHFNVKDSSHLIPGHGGFLDRIDSFILTAPVFLVMHLLGYL